MSLESASWISELDASNPTTSDKKKQGDDHLRLIKSVLKASFPTASKAFYNPTASAKTADFTITAAMMNTCFYVDTTAGTVTATLPSLAVGDAGWECSFIKTNTGTNPLFIQPASGTLQSGEISGLSKTRRAIPGHRFKAFWTGSSWFIERIPRVPVGIVLDLPHGSSLPTGYEYANGQTLPSASTNYPDFFNRNGSSGVVSDRRGRVAAGKGDMGGVADAALLTATYFGAAGTGLGNTGGAESNTLTVVKLPSHNHTLTDPGHNHQQSTTTASQGGGSTITVIGGVAGTSTFTNTTGITLANTGGGEAHANVQPTIITNFIVVVE